MSRWLGAIGDVGMVFFGIFVMAILLTNYSDKNHGTAIKRPATEITQYR